MNSINNKYDYRYELFEESNLGSDNPFDRWEKEEKARNLAESKAAKDWDDDSPGRQVFEDNRDRGYCGGNSNNRGISGRNSGYGT